MAKGWSFNGLVRALKGAAFLDVGTAANTVAAGDDSRIVNALNRTGDTATGRIKFGATALFTGVGVLGANDRGTHLGWNRTGGVGRSDFVNHSDSGAGGFDFWWLNTANTTIKKILEITGAGQLIALSGVIGATISEGTAAAPVRVYSPNNKPTPTDVGALPANGNAVSATKLQTARTIGGVSFDGTANINLPGVNQQGTQNTTGNAGTATKLQTARKINEATFDGTADIKLNLGTKLVAYANYTTLANGSYNFTAIDANTLSVVINFDGSNNFIVVGKSKMAILETTANELVGDSTYRCRKVGEFVIKSVVRSGAGDVTSTIQITYPSHGVAVGQAKAFLISVIIHEQHGCVFFGQPANNVYSQKSYALTLLSPVSSQNVPVTTSVVPGNGDWMGAGVYIFGSRMLVSDQRSINSTAMVCGDLTHVVFNTTDNNTDSWCSAMQVRIMVYDFV